MYLDDFKIKPERQKADDIIINRSSLYDDDSSEIDLELKKRIEDEEIKELDLKYLVDDDD